LATKPASGLNAPDWQREYENEAPLASRLEWVWARFAV
jgi:hypothetical protein